MPDGGDADAISRAVSERLLDPDQPALAALLALNADTLLAALGAIIESADRLDRDVQIAGVGQSPALARFDVADRNRHLAFVTSHAGEAQGYLITSALRYVHTYTTAAQFISTPTILTATPFIFDSTAIRADPEDVAAGLRRLEQRLALGEEYGDTGEQPSTDPSGVDPAPAAIESAARTLLADELDVDAGDLTLERSEPMAWSDASLGCPQEGYAYAQVITPGYRLIFNHAGVSHAVHANADGAYVVICRDG